MNSNTKILCLIIIGNCAETYLKLEPYELFIMYLPGKIIQTLLSFLSQSRSNQFRFVSEETDIVGGLRR